MVTKEDIIKLSISESEIKDCIKKALMENFNKRDNLRNRDSNIQFDCLLRGYIGEKALTKWFHSYGIEFEETNYIEDSNGEMDIDLLFIYNGNCSKSLEIKTSLLPDNYMTGINKDNIELKIEKCINNFDIKLIRRNNEPIEDIKGDIHLQVYFGNMRKAKDEFLKKIRINLEVSNKTISDSFDTLVNKIYKDTLSELYQERTFFVGWIDKENLIKQIKSKSLEKQTWTFGGSKREFWTCKIATESNAPISLIKYLQRLQNGN
jgi:hypothetical protein